MTRCVVENYNCWVDENIFIGQSLDELHDESVVIPLRRKSFLINLQLMLMAKTMMKFAPEMKFIGYELSRIGAQLKLHWTAERFQCTLEETCPNVHVF